MKELNYIKKIMIKAGKIINYTNVEIEVKNVNDLVTSKDLAVEKFLIERIQKKFPNDKFITEETNSSNVLTNERFWIIDPIDGTTNFANNIDMYSIQLALIENKEPIFSAIYNPKNKEFYYAIKNKGAFLNNVPIKTKSNKDLIQSICTFPDFTKVTKTHKKNQLILLEKLFDSVAKIKMIGSAAVDFSLLAKGSTDFHLIDKSNLWDYIPGYFLAKEAGAVFDEVKLSKNDKTTLLVVASNDHILNDLLSAIKKLNN